MTSSELRRRFLDFFEKQGHTLVPSDRLVPADDPSVLFTGAGMNQFKAHFLGLKKDLKRAASCQTCFRTGDVDEVGRTSSHLTFFEMLGNFSFGDYFKLEAIQYAWEFLTADLKLPEERLSVSVYEKDEEAAGVWLKAIGVPKERIIRFGAKENFWPSNAPSDGPNGPCGPCSEIYYDYGCCTVGKVCPKPDACAPGCPCGRFVEVWNLVFTEFNRQEGGKLVPLPAKNIDTGMGLERLAAVTQGKMNVFETDLFEPVIEAIIRLLRHEAPDVLKRDQRASVYAIADHARALTFLLAEGVVPSNEGRGYVVRMVLRKAARAGRGLGLERPFLHQLVPAVVKAMGEAYPELLGRRESIAKGILDEEERFAQTLKEKIPLLLGEIRRGPKGFPAQEAARFYDTHGLSYEEIARVCAEQKAAPPPRADFEKAVLELQAGSRQNSRFAGGIFAKDALQEAVSGIRAATEFVGYDGLTAQAKVAGLIQENRLVEEVKAPASVGVLLTRSPFYGEAGGQVGDTGILEASEGKLRVLDSQWVGAVLVHQAELTEGKVRVGDPVRAEVDPARRQAVARNHTATHLLHAGLRKVLGDHALQAGSRVADTGLRLDFSHGKALTAGERQSVEELVNEWIESRLAVSVAQMPLAQAKAAGATALFGEKYGSRVRVVSIGEVSKELCGGTHLTASGDVGLVTIVGEGSIASGVRRVEALTAEAALDSMRAEVGRLQQDRQRLIQRNKQLEEEKSSLKAKGAA